MPNTYSTSQGERLTTNQIESKMRKAKALKLELQFIEHGYNHCEKCGISSGTYLDVSHNISVKEAKESGKAELCYDLDNLTVLCRNCHKKKDKLYLQFNV